MSFSLVTFQESVRMDEILKYMIAKRCHCISRMASSEMRTARLSLTIFN